MDPQLPSLCTKPRDGRGFHPPPPLRCKATQGRSGDDTMNLQRQTINDLEKKLEKQQQHAQSMYDESLRVANEMRTEQARLKSLEQ
eukprot:9572086-Heterocapsa_arctica.AAC.1